MTKSTTVAGNAAVSAVNLSGWSNTLNTYTKVCEYDYPAFFAS